MSNVVIRMIKQNDKEKVIKMMKDFYSSSAVLSNGSIEIFNNDIDNCINDNPYIEGYVFLKDEVIIGYAMLAKSYSTEFGKKCIWIEDLYVIKDYQNQGIGSKFLNMIVKKYANCIFRLEVEEENQIAIKTYKKCGFEILPYLEMKKD